MAKELAMMKKKKYLKNSSVAEMQLLKMQKAPGWGFI